MNKIDIEAFVEAYISNIAHVTDAEKIKSIINDCCNVNHKYPDDSDELNVIVSYSMLSEYLYILGNK